ncbi:hypothetical protein KP509_1Z037200 [Ceratopteris richardii]|nr:hypothetical protein KP509_1Z037200 [Ceratopteris richardii]
MMKKAMTNAVALMLLCLVFFSACRDMTAKAQVSCLQNTQRLAPCFPYLLGLGIIPPPSCCIVVRSISLMANSNETLQSLCNCLRADVVAFAPNSVALSSLPAQCNATLGYTLTPYINCSLVG